MLPSFVIPSKKKYGVFFHHCVDSNKFVIMIIENSGRHSLVSSANGVRPRTLVQCVCVASAATEMQKDTEAEASSQADSSLHRTPQVSLTSLKLPPSPHSLLTVHAP